MEENESVLFFEEDTEDTDTGTTVPVVASADAPADDPDDPTDAPADDPEAIIAVPGDDACPLEEGTCGGISACSIWSIVAVVVVVGIIAALLGKCKSGKCGAKSGKNPAKSGSYKTASSGGSGRLVEIYVGNLSYDVDDAVLLKQFTKFGVIKSARVVINRHNNKSKGYGFVEMPHREEAEIAIKKLNNHDLLGRPMKVNEARRDSRPPERR